MARSDEDKERLIAQLSRARTDLLDSAGGVRYSLNVPLRFSKTFEKYSWGWLSLAAIVGWILSRLPSRKEKIYIHDRTHQKIAKEAKTGVLAGIIWGSIWSVARPILTSYLKQRLSRVEPRAG